MSKILFATKSMGKGKGLRLSLSYDIVKAYGGEFKVISKREKGGEFIICQPF